MKKTIERKPNRRIDNVERQNILDTAIERFNRSDWEEAGRSCRLLLERDPLDADALHLLGVLAYQDGKYAEAEIQLAKSLEIDPWNAVCQCNRGVALMELGELGAAIDCYDFAAKIDPQNKEAYFNRGLALARAVRPLDALKSFEDALKIDAGFAPALFQRAKILATTGSPQELDAAIAHYAQSFSASADGVDHIVNLGRLLVLAGRADDAVELISCAIAENPESVELHFARADALFSLNQIESAKSDFDAVLKIDPMHIGSINGKGRCYLRQRKTLEALGEFEKFVQLEPDIAAGHYNYAGALHELGRWKEALASYEIALSLDSKFEYLKGKIAHLRGRLCDWAHDAVFVGNLIEDAALGQHCAEPFPLMMLTDDPGLLREVTGRWVEKNVIPTGSLGPAITRNRSTKIHVGYYSADFHNHATSHLAAEIFELHNRRRFEVTALSFGPNEASTMRNRLHRAFDTFADVRLASDLEITAYSRTNRVDIAVDLKGYLQDMRPNILAERCAPVQINWLAYPGTMASPYIDYIIADHALIPPQDVQFYSEKVVWLPGSYQPNDGKRAIADVPGSRSEHGLPDNAFVFCSFNNTFKIRPATFDIWMKILKRVPNSVLWLLRDSPETEINLKREAYQRGVDPCRVVFAARVGTSLHLARHKLADLFLDTWPCNAHTTGSDALWAGLPIITKVGKSFASRVGASLLSAAGLAECITRSESEYEELAVKLANRPLMLSAMRQRLEKNRMSCSLFDAKRFVANLEEAYCEMMERHWAGRPPENIVIGQAGHVGARAVRRHI